jgi:hypothetical protein
MWQAGIAQLLTIFLVSVGLAVGEPQKPASGFGETLEQAKQTGFFQWFMLEQTGESAENGGQKVVFQPSGERFHNLTRVSVTLDARGRIVAVELALDREFVDSLSIGIYARDISKSFLQTGVSPPDQEAVANLVREVDQLKGSSAPVIVHQDAVKPAPQGPPSDGYRVYLGQRDVFHLVLPHGQTLDIENKITDKKGAEDQKTKDKVFTIAFRSPA